MRATARTGVRLVGCLLLVAGWCRANERPGIEVGEPGSQTGAVVKKAPRPVDREWEARLRRYKAWLGQKSRRGEAIDALAGVSDPSAVRSVWRVFVADAVPNHRVVVMLLGQIDSRPASRGLALIATRGKPAAARQAAIETLRRRDPMEFADVLIRLLRDPIRYTVRPVGGPGQPGSLTLRGESHDLQLIFAPPPPPPVAPLPGEDFILDPEGGPILLRHTDTSGLPFMWFDPPSGWIFPSGAFIPPHVPVAIPLGAMWRENVKTAQAAQNKLNRHVVAVDAFNNRCLAENLHVVHVLKEVTGEDLPPDRKTWEGWWARRIGRSVATRKNQPASVYSEIVPLDYLPGFIGRMMGYHPEIGYFVLASTKRGA